mmetsp:Transcript_9092/g.14001  ORF Transcript_9092/g.14001 Transcript_9092/m.14001 type:complete len:716 (-) Transcript_9092:221-2368(-)
MTKFNSAEEKKQHVENADLGWPEESPFHKGELQVQEKLGVMTRMDGFARKVIRRYMPEQHMQFYQGLRFVVIGCGDEDGNPWCHMVVGEPGFATASDPVELDVKPKVIIPQLISKLTPGSRIGVLGIDFEFRRRNRLNTTILEVNEDNKQKKIPNTIKLLVEQSFGNCPQYISRRQTLPFHAKQQEEERFGSILNQREKDIIETCDTFFVASLVPGDGTTLGADASHRGGRSGFVRVLTKDNASVLIVPEFPGNNHYNTFGNWKLYPKAGLLFIDFRTGAALALTGNIELFLDTHHGPHREEINAFAGAERYWTFQVIKGVSLPAGSIPLEFKEQTQDFMSPNSLLTGTWAQADAQLRAQKLTNAWRPYTVTRIVNENSLIKSFYLEPKDNFGLTDFKPGQYLTIRLGDDDTALIRTYTISVAPREGYYRISVKKEGKVSTLLHETISMGDTIMARAPRGNFYLSLEEKDKNKSAVLIGGGIGITPLLSMLRHTVREGMRTRWESIRNKTYFIHLSHDMNTRAFFQETSELAQRANPDKIQVISLLSTVDGHLTKEKFQQILPLDNYEFYICGPSSFTQVTYSLLRQSLGIRDDRIFAEAFGPSALKREPDDNFSPPEPLVPAATTPQHVRFAKTHFDTQWEPEKSGSLLELAEAHGIQVSYACRLGNCGTCVTKILKGSVTYATPLAAAADIEDAHCLLCQAVPVEQEVLELDL